MNHQSPSHLIQSRRKNIYFYSTYNFIRNIKDDRLEDIEIEKLNGWTTINQDHQLITIHIDDFQIHFYIQFLKWDSDFFLMQTYKLQYVLYDCSLEILKKAAKEFYNTLRTKGAEYIFMEIPSEDIELIQVLTGSGYKLTETRLTYFNNSLDAYNYERFEVRLANADDIKNLRRVASVMRNNYDRFHADTIFSKDLADSFLSKYIEEAIQGYSDIVLVPAAKGIKPDSFLTANYNKSEWDSIGYPVSRMVLSAVSSDTNKGWYIKLISEMTHHLKEAGARAIILSTQSTNRTVIKTWEKLGYNYGHSTHILSNSF